MEISRMQRLAGVSLNEDHVDTIANKVPTGEIVEGLALHCLENNLKLTDVIAELKEAYQRSAKGRNEAT